MADKVCGYCNVYLLRTAIMREKGFTLVELLIVVAILGIMAAIVMPTFQGNVAQAKESASKSNLATLRTQIELYKLQHNGYPPGYVNGGAAPIATMQLQLIGTTTVAGQEATAFSAAVDGTSSGWLYKMETGEIVLNWTGTDSEGVAYYDY